MTTLPTVFITGASSGIGATYAERFARRGHDLVLVARDKSRLDNLAARLRAESNVAVEVLPADLTSAVDLSALETRLRDDARIGILINNAGMAQSGGFLAQSAEAIERLITLNTTALTRLAAAPPIPADCHIETTDAATYAEVIGELRGSPAVQRRAHEGEITGKVNGAKRLLADLFAKVKRDRHEQRQIQRDDTHARPQGSVRRGEGDQDLRHAERQILIGQQHDHVHDDEANRQKRNELVEVIGEGAMQHRIENLVGDGQPPDRR